MTTQTLMSGPQSDQCECVVGTTGESKPRVGGGGQHGMQIDGPVVIHPERGPVPSRGRKCDLEK